MLYIVFFLSLFLNTCVFSMHDTSYSKAVVRNIGMIFKDLQPGDSRDFISFSCRYSIIYSKDNNEFVITRLFEVPFWQNNIRLVEDLDMHSTISRIDSKVIIKTKVTREQIDIFLAKQCEPLTDKVRKIIKKFFMKSSY